jgi:membrane protease YdiL (CAAX protease family)
MQQYRIPIALAAMVAWILITVWGVWTPHEATSIVQSVAGGIAWQIVGAGLFLLALVLVMRWDDMAFNAPSPWASLRVLWFPAIYLALFAAAALFVGLPGPQIILFLAINTLAVGFSEELMFRGVLYRALRTRLNLWPAIWISCVLFGSVHVINAFTTGDVLGAVVQATTAFMSGVFFLAIVLRTGSIIPSMLFHAGWDFLLTVTASSVPVAEAATSGHSTITILAPLAFILPNFVYALFLLRKVGGTVEASRPVPA